MTIILRSYSPNYRRNVRTSQSAQPRRAVYRERETGVGYGNSSGYATTRRYVRGWEGEPLFRCS